MHILIKSYPAIIPLSAIPPHNTAAKKQANNKKNTDQP